MTIDSLVINQLSPQGWQWYQGYLARLDAYDVNRFAEFLSQDVAVQFNNDEPLVGRDVAKAGLGQFWESITAMGYSLEHEPLNIYGDDQHFVLEALNHYHADDGTRITVRATAWTDRDEAGAVKSIRLYQDLSALYAHRPG